MATQILEEKPELKSFPKRIGEAFNSYANGSCDVYDLKRALSGVPGHIGHVCSNLLSCLQTIVELSNLEPEEDLPTFEHYANVFRKYVKLLNKPKFYELELNGGALPDLAYRETEPYVEEAARRF